MKKTPQKAKYILAIDQGTTGTTAAIFNFNSKNRTPLVAQTDADFRQYFPKPGWVEHRADEIWQTVEKTVRAVLKKSKVRPSQLAAIGITNQRETLVVWEKKTGKSVAPVIVWQDRRTAEDCAQLKKQGLEPEISRKTGLLLDPYFTGTKLSWHFKNNPALKKRADAGELRAGTIDSYLLAKLTGGDSFKTDVTNASRTLLMNLQTLNWDPELLKVFSIPAQILPDIAASSSQFGVTRGLKFLPDGIPITGMVGDQQAALFGQACFEAGEAKCTFGTGSFMLMNTGSQIERSKKGLLTTVAWKLHNEQTASYALEGGAFVCGAAVQFLRDQLGFIKKASEIEALAKKVKSSDGVEFVPALTGLGAPYWDPEARGLICGLTRGSTRAHIARATLDAMALQNAEILIAMNEDIKSNSNNKSSGLNSLKVDGGASANQLLMQIQADVLGVPVVRPQVIETTAMGAAMMAAYGVGIFKSREEMRKGWKADQKFSPQVTQIQRAERIKLWKRAVNRSLSASDSI